MFLSKRNGYYYLYYIGTNGKRNKVSTHATIKTDALKFLQTFQESQQKKRCKTFGDFLTDFFSYVQANYSKRSFRMYRDTIRHFLEVVPESTRLNSITARHWDLFTTRRLKSHSPVSVNIELRSLKAMMNTAARWEDISRNPFSNCLNCFVEEKNPEYITPEDFAMLIDSIKEQWLKELVIFTVLTGLRRGEVANLKWEHINLEKKVALIVSTPTFKTKGGRKRVISLNDSAIYLLNQMTQSKESVYVFSLNGKKIDGDWMSKKFSDYVHSLDIRGKICFHTLRHTFSSWLVMKGISIYSVSKLLGHSSVVTTQKYYAYLQPDSLHDQVNSISYKLR